MESKKDIGKFFRENLDQLDANPKTLVWDGIERKLKEKKKKRRFLWFFIISFFVVSVFSYTLLYTYLIPATNSENNKITIPSNEEPNRKESVKTNLKVEPSISIQPNDDLINSTTTAHDNTPKKSKPTNYKERKANKIQIGSITKKRKSEYLAFGSKKSNQKKIKKNKNTPQEGNLNSSSIKESLTLNEANEAIVESQKGEASTTNESKTMPVDTITKKKNLKVKKEKALTQTKKDSTIELPGEKSYDLIIAPYYSFTYAGKIGEGNSLSSNYNITNEGGKISPNFGLLLRWMGTERLGIQTGVGKLQSNRFTEVEKNSSLFAANSNLELDLPLAFYESAFQNDDEVKFYQEYAYIEVPLEAYYIVSNKKIGWAGSFGVSFFILDKNEIFLESDTVEKFRIGSAKNALPFTYTLNAKFNLFYNLSEKIQLDFYPEFQFQLMSHKDASNFNPYYLSLKAGISYKL